MQKKLEKKTNPVSCLNGGKKENERDGGFTIKLVGILLFKGERAKKEDCVKDERESASG